MMNGEFLKIENIGCIKDAYIKLDGLNVVAGKNDTGKSTVGKIMFSIVKGISRHKEDFQSSKEQEVRVLIDKIYYRLRRELDTRKEFEETRRLFYPPVFWEAIKHLLNEDPSKESVVLLMDERIQYLRKVFTSSDQEEYIKLMESIIAILSRKDTKKDKIEQALTKAFFSEFYNELTPKKALNEESRISYHSLGKIFEITIEHNKIKNIVLEDELLFQDVTYVESPVYLQLANVIKNAETRLDFDMEKSARLMRNRPKVSFHIKDLITKLEQSMYYADSLFDNNRDLLSSIAAIVRGAFEYDEKTSEFKFKRNQEMTVNAVNTASGIKAFGMIQLLIQANALNERSMLIVDEPENHLHPEWQVKYADIITELVKKDISVLINSHSPYMIQALSYFAEKKDIKDKTSFFLTKRIGDSQMTTFENITDDLERIFRTLAEPINKIMW